MTFRIIQGDCLEVMRTMDAESVDCVVTSPPYWGLRNYGVDGQLGLEKTPEEYVAKMVGVFAEVRRVLKKTGTCWINLGDSYASAPAGNFGPDMPAPADGGRYRENKPKMDWKVAGLKPKDLCGIPWRVAFALQADGWWLRQDIIWAKPNPMPESVTDRCTKSHEYLFLLTKSARYYFDAKAIAEPMTYYGVTGMDESGYKDAGNFNGKHKMRPVYGAPAGNIPGGKNQTGRLNGGKDVECSGMRNKRSVWTIPTQAFAEAHFATFPEALVSPCVLAGCPADGIVLDPFNGAGTTGIVALKHGRSYIGIELNPAYVAMAEKRIRSECGLLI